MKVSKIKFISSLSGKWWVPVLLFVTFVVLALASARFFLPTPALSPAVDHDDKPPEEMLASTSIASLPPSEPIRLRIPTIDIDVPFSESLGITSEGAVEVPTSFDTVGWYRFGPTPGEVGPAVVLGHVDSYLGPAVFFSLGQLDPGDDIFIDRADGSVAHFRVTSLNRHPQSEFPTKAVYGDIPSAGLRLITCTGLYVHASQRYTHNLIVFAELVSPD